MSSVIYKPGQGYWTRLMSAIGWGVIVGFAALWTWSQLATANVSFQTVYLQGGVAAGVLLLGGALVYFFVYVRSNTSEFLIATDGEMRKVNWSTRREIIGSAWVVIAISVMIATLLFVVDILFSQFFKWVGVIDA